MKELFPLSIFENVEIYLNFHVTYTDIIEKMSFYKQRIIMLKLKGYNQKEIAEILNKTPQYVSLLVKDIKGKLI